MMPLLQLIWSFSAALSSGMWALLEWHMIVRWMSLLPLFWCCIQLKWEEAVKINCDGFPPKEVCSKSNPSFALWDSKGSRFSWKNVWQSQAPSRAAFCVWSVALGNILTLDDLRKRHVIVMGHLLFHCDVASAILSPLFSRFVLS